MRVAVVTGGRDYADAALVRRTLGEWKPGTSEPSVVDWLHWRQALGMSVAPNLAQENRKP